MSNINDYGFPFNSVGTDRTYGSSDWREYFKGIMNDGVVNVISNKLVVSQSGTPAKTVKVDTGGIFIQGAIRIVDVFETLSIADNASGNPRIDRIVARLDYTDRLIELAVLQGTPAGSPTAPALTQDTDVWEIALAQVAVANGFATIINANITDERTYGLVKSNIITTDSTSTTPTVVLASTNEYRFTDDAISTLGITIPPSLAEDFLASVVWRNPTPTATLTVTNNSGLTLKYSGDGVAANVFAPVVNTTYNMIFFHDGVNINCIIRGA